MKKQVICQLPHFLYSLFYHLVSCIFEFCMHGLFSVKTQFASFDTEQFEQEWFLKNQTLRKKKS